MSTEAIASHQPSSVLILLSCWRHESPPESHVAHTQPELQNWPISFNFIFKEAVCSLVEVSETGASTPHVHELVAIAASTCSSPESASMLASLPLASHCRRNYFDIRPE